MAVKTLNTFVDDGLTATGVQTRSDYTYTGTKNGQKVDSWKQKIANGANASSPYSVNAVRVETASPHGVSLRWVRYNNGVPIASSNSRSNGYGTSIVQMGFAHSAAITPAAEAEALKRIYQKIREENSGMNGLLFLGELRETIQMLKNPLSAAKQGVSKYLDTLKSTREEVRRNVKQRKSETSDALRKRRANAVKNGMAGSWLELQFGIKPLISDTEDIYDATIDLAYGRRSMRRLSAKSPDVPGFATQTFGNSSHMVGCVKNWRYTKKGKASVRYTVGLKHSLGGPISACEQARRRLGFTLENFVPTAYELVPWSFLIDYFVNAGDILEAACTDTSNVAYIVKTVRTVTVMEISTTLVPVSPGTIFEDWRLESRTGGTFDKRIVTRTTLDRTLPGSLGIPSLTFSVPGTDSSKWLNMGALLAQARDFRF